VHSHTSVRILSVSDHESVRISRELLLQNVGYSVVSMSSDCALKQEIPRDIEIAIIGQTVEEPSASRIVERLRTIQPHLRILRLAEPNASIGYEYDCVCLVEDGPGVLLGCLAEMVANAETVGSEPISTRHVLTRQRDDECD
jgi:hypothetical protein